MPTTSTIRTVGLPVLLFGLFLIGCLFLAPRLNPIPPRTMSYHIEAGDVSRGMVASATRITGRGPMSIRPHHLTFTSSNGPVEIFVNRFDLAAGADAVREMQTVTEQIRRGEEPADLIARASGTEGTIPLHWWPYGNVRYVVFLRPETTSDVTVTVHYGP